MHALIVNVINALGSFIVEPPRICRNETKQSEGVNAETFSLLLKLPENKLERLSLLSLKLKLSQERNC